MTIALWIVRKIAGEMAAKAFERLITSKYFWFGVAALTLVVVGWYVRGLHAEIAQLEGVVETVTSERDAAILDRDNYKGQIEDERNAAAEAKVEKKAVEDKYNKARNIIDSKSYCPTHTRIEVPVSGTCADAGPTILSVLTTGDENEEQETVTVYTDRDDDVIRASLCSVGKLPADQCLEYSTTVPSPDGSDIGDWNGSDLADGLGPTPERDNREEERGSGKSPGPEQ